MTPAQAVALVEAQPSSLSKDVSLAIIAHPKTQFRVDQHHMPAWTWRDGQGDAGFGACVHIHPDTGEPYLETQFPEDGRPAGPLSPRGETPR